MKKTNRIIDTTLREGEQTPGLSFSLVDRKRIIDGLAAIGVDEIEVGIATTLAGDIEPLLKYCRSTHPTLSLSLWSRCCREDVRMAGRLRPDVLSLSIPVSDIHLEERLGKDRAWARRQMNEAIARTRAAGMGVSVGFEDATRAESGFLIEMAILAVQAGAERIRLADTVGICSPLKIYGLFTMIQETVGDCELAVHTHNDYGMATANALTALEAGASWTDATVLGLGERAGCARLEEIVGFLALEQGRKDLAPEHLKGLAEYVASRASHAIDPARPLIGDRIFTCETGLHLQGLQKNPRTYEPYPPESVGARRTLLYGSKCGRRAFTEKLLQLGCPLEKGQINRHITSLRERARAKGIALTDTELLADML